MISLQEGVVARGTGRSLQSLNRPLGGKSGTTNDFKDAWFIASSPHLVAGVVIFFDHPTYLGKDESGGRLAAPIARDFLKGALEGVPPVPFPAPSGIKFVKVNIHTGRTTSSNQDAILEAFRAGTESITETAKPHTSESDANDLSDPEGEPKGNPLTKEEEPAYSKDPSSTPVLEGIY
jgi:penicillin-binding protein 1A